MTLMEHVEAIEEGLENFEPRRDTDALLKIQAAEALNEVRKVLRVLAADGILK